ncbi:hypothetical protein KDH_29190 [Dictyobacter sp. S3.2.2.5]|uniref:Uncharacterized protein n=1 Tax=Dictyobacter halimunensis TaxID=3026934 RepID=A0ABQ6FQW5_9CHLR|nr:hypothetical protein KDH_29190 [Dictyobacter sp. S3.2.2.5]
MEKKTFGEPVQTATVVGAAYGIHRTTLTQAAKAGVLGRSAYRSGDAWLIKTDHPDFWEWLRGHEYHPRVKGYRKQQAAKAAQQRLLEEEGMDVPPQEAHEMAGSPTVHQEARREPEQKQQEAVTKEPPAEGDRRAAPSSGGDAPMDRARHGDPVREPDLVVSVVEDAVDEAAGATEAGVSARRQRRLIAYMDVRRGEGMTDAGERFTFGAQASLSEVLAAVPQLGDTNQVRLWLCGELPTDTSGSYEGWVLARELRQRYTTGARGHYLSDERPEETVARYRRRGSEQELEIRHVFSWFGTECTATEAYEAIRLLSRYLQATFGEEASAYATPALTFQALWTRLNRLQKRSFAPLPAPIRETIRSHAGQGRIELCTLPELKRLPGLYYYDGIFMYSALAWGLPTELAIHDSRNEYAGKVAARYRIRYTIPTDWQHLGLFMTPRDAITGNQRDRHTWSFPGAESAGQTYETWVDGSELDVLSSAYASIEEGFAVWRITILERIVFKPEKASTQKKPLDGLVEKLANLREKVERDAQETPDETRVYQLVRGGIRNIVLHGIGTFNRSSRTVTYILGMDESAPNGYSSRREIDADTVWYSVPAATEGYSQQFDHPEWAAQVWARCRARMIKAALMLPRESIIAIRTDAIALTQEHADWNANTRRGTLRLKWAIRQPVKAPHTYEALDQMQRKPGKDR